MATLIVKKKNRNFPNGLTHYFGQKIKNFVSQFLDKRYKTSYCRLHQYRFYIVEILDFCRGVTHDFY